ncbi:MAG: hypothetical protein R2850_08910 [Bacteroidia bacterium]
MNYCFNDDNRTIYDKSEIDCTEAHQVSAYPKTFIIPRAKSIANGITEATINPASTTKQQYKNKDDENEALRPGYSEPYGWNVDQVSVRSRYGLTEMP